VFYGLFDVRLAGNNTTGLGAFFPQDASQFTRINFSNRRNATAAQKLGKRQFVTPVTFHQRQIANDQSSGKNLAAFEILAVGSGIADMRVCQGDDLAGIGRISKNFLIARHGSIEHHFTNGAAFGAYRNAVKKGAVLESQQCRYCHK